MLVTTSREELSALAPPQANWTLWLHSADRRGQREDNTPAYRFLQTYSNKAFVAIPQLTTVMLLGCLNGQTVNLFIRRPTVDRVRLMGYDPDPECLLGCRDRFASVASKFKFAGLDPTRFPKFPKALDFVIVNRLIERLPHGTEFLSHAWENCNRAMLVVVSESLVDQPEDSLVIDTISGKLAVRYSKDQFLQFLETLSGGNCESVTVFADNSQSREYIFLLRKDLTVSDFSEVFRFHEDASGILPWYRKGLYL